MLGDRKLPSLGGEVKGNTYRRVGMGSVFDKNIIREFNSAKPDVIELV